MKEEIDTLIGEKSRLNGDIRFKGGLHVDGRVEGSVIAEGGAEDGLVVVSERGSIKGTITAPKIVVNGTVDGDIVCSDKLELQEKARVTGNIQYQSIEMKIGAQVTGQLMVASTTRQATTPGA
jgi:cytoskeletal protein CcmA (bactofilin family)